MTLQSMTGFARREDSAANRRWVWELRSVNGKGLDLRIRLPQGCEHYEPEARRLCAAAFKRGNLQISLSTADIETTVRPVVNEQALASVLEIAGNLRERFGAEPPRIDGLLNIRGILEFREPDIDEETLGERDAACLESLERAFNDLKIMREGEGAALAEILTRQVEAVETLVETIESDPSRDPAVIRDRLSGQIALLVENSRDLDAGRLEMEAAILATKADLREEIDRLHAHVAACRELLAAGGPIGRRLDFLAQEFNREANTVCSKSNATAVTAAGLELKVVVDQFREQIQNLE